MAPRVLRANRGKGPPVSVTSARLCLGFAFIGHAFAHMVPPVFYVAALSLERELALSHGEAVALIVVGNVLYGLLAPLAGWLSDRWNALGMVELYFRRARRRPWCSPASHGHCSRSPSGSP